MSADDQVFWAAWLELAAARLMEQLEFTVELAPTLQGKTPDLLATGRSAIVVEVLYVNPPAHEVAEDERIARLSSQVRDRVRLAANSFLSLSVGEPLRSSPSNATVEGLCQALQEWIDAGHPGRFDFTDPELRMTGLWMPHSEADVGIGPSARWGNGPKRFQDRIETKMGRYRGLVELGFPLVIVVGASYWTLTIDAMIAALFGGERVSVSVDETGSPSGGASSHFSGAGVLVAGGPSGHAMTEGVAGLIWMELAGFDADQMAFRVRVAFVHNPYSQRRIDTESLTLLPQYVDQGGAMTWTGEDGPVPHWLDCPPGSEH